MKCSLSPPRNVVIKKYANVSNKKKCHKILHFRIAQVLNIFSTNPFIFLSSNGMSGSGTCHSHPASRRARVKVHVSLLPINTHSTTSYYHFKKKSSFKNTSDLIQVVLFYGGGVERIINKSTLSKKKKR